MYDVVVVGAGPAGSAAARYCAGHGLKTLCIEEHATIGYPVQCAGLLSTAALRECRVSRRCVLNEVSGARVVSGRGRELLFDARVTKAYVVDRGILDLDMAHQAADAGAEFMLKTSVCGISGSCLLTRGAGGRRQVPYRLLIAADGARSSIARMQGMARAQVYLSGLQADIPHEMDPRYVEVHPDASPAFFGWVVPISGSRARVGLCGFTGVKECFSGFISRYGAGSSVHLVTGTIPLGVMPRTYGHRTLFVGDAAGFAKPTSGGGIYTGVRSARHAAAVAADCCMSGVAGDAALSEYERRWRADFGRELELGMRLLRMRRHLTPAGIDRLLRVMNDPDIVETIVADGDMDRPGRLVRRLAVKPKVMAATAGLIGQALGGLLKNQQS